MISDVSLEHFVIYYLIGFRVSFLMTCVDVRASTYELYVYIHTCFNACISAICVSCVRVIVYECVLHLPAEPKARARLDRKRVESLSS